MADIGDYNFLVTNLLTGNVIDVVELGSFYWDEIFNAPGAGLGTARLDIPSTTEANFRDWRNGLWVVKDGDIKWGGIIGKTQVRGGTHVLNVPVHGFMSYFNSRIIRNADAMSHGALVRTSDIEWRDVDQFNIVKDIIDHTQSFQDGDLGIDVTWDALSGVELTIIIRTFTVKRAGNAIQELSARLQGFNYRQVYEWDGNKPKCKFKLFYPTHSTVVDDYLLYQPERITVTTEILQGALDLDGSSSVVASSSATIDQSMSLVLILNADDYSSGSSQFLINEWLETGNNRSWRLYLNSTGSLIFDWSTNGSNSLNATSSVLPVDSGELTVKIDFNHTTGNVDFYTSTDYGANYTLLNTDTGAGATSIYDSGTADLILGLNASGAQGFIGQILLAQVFKGATLQAVFDARSARPGNTIYTDAFTNVWTLTDNAEFIGYLTTDKETREPTPRRSNILEYDDEGVDAFSTGLAVIGGGEGNSQKLIYISNTNGGAPLWEDKLTFTDEFDESILLQRGKLSLDACSSSGDRNLNLIMDSELPPFQDDIYTGDSARVIINDQMKQEDDLYWVGRKRLTLGEDQNDDITLEIVKRTLIRLIYGYGSAVLGGLSKELVIVTNTNNSGAGSLREALSAGDRYIQIDASLAGGVIDLTTDIQCDTFDNITINGLGRVTITGAQLDFVNCDELEIVDLTFATSDNASLIIRSKTGVGQRDIHFLLNGCRFTGPGGEQPVQIIENYGHNVYGTIAYCVFDKHDDTFLVDSGTNEGGIYNLTFHNCWFKDCIDQQPSVNSGNFHIFNCLYERYGDIDGSHTGYESAYFDDFATVNTYDNNAFGADWEAYDSAGNAGNGLRRTTAVSVVNSSTQSLLVGDPPVSNGTAAQIRASWDGSNITSGIVQLTAEPILYGRVRFRAKATGDSTNQLSPVILMWPSNDLWPSGGEIDIWEGFNARDDLNPMESFLHRENPLSPGNDEQLSSLVWATPDIPYNALGTDWHTYELIWLPNSLSITVDDTHTQVMTTDPTWIPSTPMKFSIQLDAWSNSSLSSDVFMWVDWVSIEQATFATSGGGGGAVVRDDGNLLVEYSVAIPRIEGEIIGYNGGVVNDPRTEFTGPVAGESSAIVSALNNTLLSGATETDQNQGSVFIPPYTFYRDPTPNAELIRWESGPKLNGPQSTDYTVWNYPASSPPVSSGPLSITAVTNSRGTGGPQLVANPNQGSGKTIIFMCVAPGPGESTSGSFTVPHASATQIFDYDAGGSSFVPRVRMWSLTENGLANYTFGWSDASDTQHCLAWVYDGVASSITVGTQNVAGSDTLAFLALSGVAVDDHITAIAINQGLEAITNKATPIDTADFNDTGLKFGVGLFTGVITSGTSITPGSVTWESEGQASIQIVMKATGVGSGGSSGNVKLPDTAWTVLIDVENYNTWGPSRTNGQLIVAGNRFNAGAVADNINAGAGWGLSFDSFQEVNSFVMENGDDLRLGAKTVTGLFNINKALVAQSQWDPANNYNSDAEGGWPAGGSTPIGLNYSVAWPGTDRLYFDGCPRIQYSQIPTSATDPKAIKVSLSNNTADEFILGSITQVQNFWRDGADAVIGPSVHAPVNGPLAASQFNCYADYNGNFIVITRDKTTAWTSGDVPGTTRYTRAISAGDVGDWWGIIFHAKLDANNGFLDCWFNTGSGWTKVVNLTSGVGYAQADGTSWNDIWYAQMDPHLYVYHRYTNNLTENWDSTYGNVRTVASPRSGLILNPTSGTIDLVKSDFSYLLEG